MQFLYNYYEYDGIIPQGIGFVNRKWKYFCKAHEAEKELAAVR